MPFCQYKHVDVHYTDSGKGPAVVLVHGFLENLTMWDDYTAALSKHYRVIRVDLLGHGQTPNLGYVHSMEEMADAVKAVLDHLKLRKYTLIGHSMGGYVSLAFAEGYPDNLRGLCLFYSTAKEDAPEKKEMRLRAIEAVKHNYKTYIRAMIPSLFAEENQAKYRDRIDDLIHQALEMTPQGIVAALAGMRERKDREALLHFGPYPVCIINGKQDSRIPAEELESQLAAPNVNYHLETPYGHMGHIEDEQKCLQYLENFIKAVSK